MKMRITYIFYQNRCFLRKNCKKVKKYEQEIEQIPSGYDDRLTLSEWLMIKTFV